MMKGKHWVAFGGIALMICNDTLARKVDRNLLRPLRNYHTTLSDSTSFRMQEDLELCMCELGSGIRRMFTIESDA